MLAYRNVARTATCDYLQKKWLQFSGTSKSEYLCSRSHLAAVIQNIYESSSCESRKKDAAVLTDRMKLLNAT